jgi:hypothetical protein
MITVKKTDETDLANSNKYVCKYSHTNALAIISLKI